LRGRIHNQNQKQISIIMKIDSLVRRLVALKKIIPAVLLLGSLSLGLVPKAVAQFTFTIDEFTSDVLTITVNSGTLQGIQPATNAFLLMFVDADNHTNTTWINAGESVPGTLLIGPAQIGTRFYSSATVFDDSFGDAANMNFSAALVSGASVVTPFTVSWAFAGAFNTSAVSEFALYWGDGQTDGTAVLQSVGLAATGSTSSAVPEPSTYAALAGLCALGFAAWRRRRTGAAVSA